MAEACPADCWVLTKAWEFLYLTRSCSEANCKRAEKQRVVADMGAMNQAETLHCSA